MSIAIISHSDCVEHGAGILHPETGKRLSAIQNTLLESQLEPNLNFYEAPLADRNEIYRVHDTNYVDSIFNLAPKEGVIWLDPDTFMTPASLNAALRAAGANVLAVDLLMNNEVSQVFCNVRPPGHHAEYDQAMGFCLFNNIAVAAAYAQEKYKLERIAIIDFDVHHGNGTEDIFCNEPNILFCSLFQHPFYPFKGSDTQIDHIVNVLIPAGTDGAEYRKLFTSKCIPPIEAFEPELMLVSAGFDAHIEDELAGLCLTEKDYAWLGKEIKNIANKYCDGKISFTLEGGYSLPALSRSVLALLNKLLD
jgi:acetoin utilization deacetylase AcuC-like enzyme